MNEIYSFLKQLEKFFYQKDIIAIVTKNRIVVDMSRDFWFFYQEP